MFWTTAIPEASVEKGLFQASMEVSDLAIPDYFTIANALFGGGPEPEPATVSFHVWWDIDERPFNFVNDEQDFAGTFTESTAPDAAGIAWSAMNENSGFSYESTGSENHFALLGHERNGDFRYGRWGRRHPKP